MKKIFKYLICLFVFTFSLVACGGNNTSSNNSVTTSSSSEVVKTKHTVQFYVEDELFKTLKVEDGSTIGSDKVGTPMKDGFSFVSWVDKDNTVIDLDTYVVTSAVKFYATFEEIITDDTLIVNGKKEEGKEYYLVVGWWETTALNDDGTPKITSSLTVDTVRLFYANLNLYLKAYGATEDQIKNVQFRDYSSATVAEMGASINKDADVDLVIGVGNNINSTAGVSLFEGNDGKQTAKMGSQGLSRYVALPEHETMNNVAISVFDWIKTETGQKAFTTPLTAAEIVVAPERTDDIAVTVKVYGVSGDPVVTNLTSKKDPIAVPEITLEAGYKFLGYATTQNAEVAEVAAAIGVALTYADIEGLLNGATSIELYPVIVEEIINTTYDLVVYVHVVSSAKINEAEASLFADRFEATLTEEKNINYVWVTEGKADDFTARVNEDLANGETIDVVIGGNKSTATFTAIDETYVNASCAAGHFADGSRKIVVLNSCASTHVDLAKAFYTFMTTEAPELSLSIAFWTKTYTWVTEAEVNAIQDGIRAHINTLFGVEDAFTTYKITINFFVCENTKVAALSEETKALNDGKGVGMIVGTGGNAADEGNMGSAIIEQKDIPTSIVANNRKVAICDNNSIYQDIYNNYFAEAVVEDSTVTE